MRSHELTPSHRRRGRVSDQPVTIGIDLCRSALASLTSEIVEDTMQVTAAELRRHGLQGTVGDYEGLRQALRNIVTHNLRDMLAERIKEIDDEPDLSIRADLKPHRETLAELLLECRQ